MKSRLWIVLGTIGFLSVHGYAQQTGILNQLREEEQSTIAAIALYPQKERTALLEASLHPEILVRMENIRQNTEDQFREKVKMLPEEDQKKIYNLVRYPDLMTKICDSNSRMSNQEMKEVLQAYPEEIREDAMDINQKYFDQLKEIQHMYTQADDAFHAMLAAYPESVRASYYELLNLPAVVSVLTENMSLTVLLGDIYSKHPEQLTKELDSLNVVLAEQQAMELNDWKQELEENPEAMAEYEQAAKEFAADQGYDDDVYNGPAPDVYADQVYVDYVWQPYPYWFGWPYWYSYPCWYPYPYWYHWGYYYGPGGAVFYLGFPSSFFIGWTFYDYHHFYPYPHFTDEVIGHYYGPRHTGAAVQPVLRNFEEGRKSAVSSDWFKDPENRVERIREYGKFKMDYDEAVRVSAGQAPPTEREFLKTNVDKYPTLEPVLRQPVEKEYQPKKPRAYEPFPKGLPEKYVPKEKVVEKESAPRTETIDRAKETHQNAWERLRPAPAQQPQRQPQQTSPARQQPQKSSAPPKQSAPPRKKN
jgi:hypothetical protein